MPNFRVGKPRLRITRASTLNTVGNAVIPLPFEVADFDDEAMWNAAVPTDVVIERDGLYGIDFTVHRGATAAAAAWFVRLIVNGATHTSERAGAVQLTNSLSGSDLAELVAGDVVRLDVQPTATAGQASSLLAASRLCVVRLGPVRWV